MRWFKNHWTEISLLILMAAIFYALGGAPEIFGFRICDVEVLSLSCFGASMFFIGILCAWIAMEFVFRPFNRFVDIGHFEEAFEELRPKEQVILVVGTLIILIFLFIHCCSLLS